MDTICSFLILDHQRCDDLFNQASTCVQQRKWEEATPLFREFHDALKQHIRMEEKVVLPAFSQAMSDGATPVAMLHLEHERIRGIADRMFEALERVDGVDFMLHAETYQLLMQQHTMKEEDMLYPLLDKILFRKRVSIISAMAEFIKPQYQHARC